MSRGNILTTDPEEVRAVFLKRGWKGLERNYGYSNDVLMQLIERAGGKALLADRAAIQSCGRLAGGRPVNPSPPERVKE